MWATGAGNLYIAINVNEHPVFERDGADIHVKVRLTLAEAVLGHGAPERKDLLGGDDDE